MPITDIYVHVPQGISSVILNYIVRSVNLDPNLNYLSVYTALCLLMA